jgi:hypothetical protein
MQRDDRLHVSATAGQLEHIAAAEAEADGRRARDSADTALFAFVHKS